MTKILFFIHDLGPGGAEKVLVNLVNNMDSTKFDITVMALFDGGVNRQFLAPHIRYRTVFPGAFPGNSHIMKLFSPKILHRWLIREHFDIEVSYLEGPAARIISGCPDKGTKKISWIHAEQLTLRRAAAPFRSRKEALNVYNSFDRIICVSESVREDFRKLLPVCVPIDVLYNTNESETILALAQEPVEPGLFDHREIKLAGVGKLLQRKGFHRLIPILRRLRDDGLPVHLYILGTGPRKRKLEQLAGEMGVSDSVTFLGYQINPYKYMARCDLFLCASFAEGFSTAATEALIVGTPVCTVEVSGMKEMLGRNNQWGIVTENDDEALYWGIRHLLNSPAILAHYRKQAEARGKAFCTKSTVRAVEEMLLGLSEMSATPLISVLVPAYNAAPWLPGCLDSILGQTYQKLEVIVVDDGSTDETGSILDRYAAKDPRIRAIHQGNKGLAATREAGIAAATGDYIGFVDSDDTITPDMYERLLKNALKYSADISHCGMSFVYPDGREEPHYGTGDVLVQDKREGLRELLTGTRMEPSLCNKLYAARLMPGSCPDTSVVNNEDLLRNFTLFSRAERSVFEDFCGYHYHQRPGSMSGDTSSPQQRLEHMLRARRLILDSCMEDTYPWAMRLWLSTHVNAVNQHSGEPEMNAFCADCRRVLIRERKHLHYLIKRQQIAAWLIIHAPWLHCIVYKFYNAGRGKP